MKKFSFIFHPSDPSTVINNYEYRWTNAVRTYIHIKTTSRDTEQLLFQAFFFFFFFLEITVEVCGSTGLV